MMHVSPDSFRPGPAQAAAVPPVAPLTAAGYFRLRQAHAKLSDAQLADRLTQDASQRSEVLMFIRQLKTDGFTAHRRETITRIADVMPLDAAVYWQLKVDPAGRQQICHGCGYTVWDAFSAEDMILGWATDTSCTRCTPVADADL